MTANDGAAFDDPDAWGFCKYCAFEVAVDIEAGRIYPHDRRAGDWAMRRCYGSLLEPTPLPTPERRPVLDALTEALVEHVTGPKIYQPEVPDGEGVD